MGINVRLWPSPVIGLGKRIEITVGRKRFRDQVTEEDLSSAFTQLHITPELFLPEQTRLLQNYPNPFNPEVWILFELAKDSEVSVIIYDMAGSQTRQLVWDRLWLIVTLQLIGQPTAMVQQEEGETVASSVYFCQVRAEKYTQYGSW